MILEKWNPQRGLKPNPTQRQNGWGKSGMQTTPVNPCNHREACLETKMRTSPKLLDLPGLSQKTYEDSRQGHELEKPICRKKNGERTQIQQNSQKSVDWEETKDFFFGKLMLKN